MKLIATGHNVFDTSREPEGVVKFLGTPIEVLDLVTSGQANRFIILAQGGTTTFLSPILAEGTLGILTMDARARTTTKRALRRPRKPRAASRRRA